MAVVTVQIQIPVRAFWWVKHLALQRRMTVEGWIEDMVLRELGKDERVNLSRSPMMGEG
ncbi:MAG: hypothetical protein ACRDL7_00120 [Gaiellaceae bacterium]